ncbi:MAG: anaerobic glycerol-3-phosphate dehydrogenase subunit B [Chloroflexi bacterium HGW-Chloroflexi-1]|nr:MAG: anaerobic glycerol-3-phosphate dehydrogenase subunit B [Chloroflexi bacterium HGW-Chloroflexi-1]
MDDILVVGAGPAGLLAAWSARQRGATVRLVAVGIGATHVAPGWIRVWNGHVPGTSEVPGTSLERWIADHPAHPYALAGLDALHGGIAAFKEVCGQAGLNYVGDPAAGSNFRLPTALGAVQHAALAPESFVAGDLRQPGDMLIAGPAGWRDFYPRLCAENLSRQGYPAQGVTFDLPEMGALSRFDATPVGLARLFDRPEVRERVAARLKPRLDGAARVGLPAVIGYASGAEAWCDLQERLGVPVFEIPTLPPSVPGIRVFDAFKQALRRAGVNILLDMTATRGIVEDGRLTGVVIPTVSRAAVYRADKVILATGGLYGGGIASDHHGQMREVVLDLPVQAPGGLGDWFADQLISEQGHPVHYAGVRANHQLQPVDEAGNVLLENVRVAGRLLAGYNPVVEGSAEGVLLATAYCAAQCISYTCRGDRVTSRQGDKETSRQVDK